MKFFRYIFIVFIVAIIGYSGYKIYTNNKIKNEEVETNKNEQEDIAIKDIRLGICNYDSINPLITNNKEIIDIAKLIFDPLFSITKDYKIEPCIATECSKTGDTTYVVKVDTNVKWHDGSYLTAKDVKYTIETIQSGNSIYKANVENIIATEVLDASTIKITLNKGIPFFEYNLTFPILNSIQYTDDNLYTSSKVPLGTGRFKISDITTTSITLSKNTNWRKIVTDESKIDTIKINIYQAMGGVFNGFKLNNVDIFSTSNVNYKDYIGSIGFNVTEYAGRDFDFLSFNCQDEILKNKAVRQAINYAIDRNTIVAVAYGTQKMVSYYPLDYGSYLYTNDGYLNNNSEKAKEILVKDGWTYNNNEWTKIIDNKVKKLELNLSVQESNSGRLAVANEIKKELANIGIKINIITLSDSNYDKMFETRGFQMLITGVYNSYTPNINYFLHDGNIGGYHNAEVNSILNSQISTKNDKLIVDGYKKVYDIYKDELPFLGLYRGKNIIISTQSLVGTITANNYSSFYNIATWYRQ